MMKRVVIVHGWDGSPQENWFPWLKNELEADGFKVLVPQMPDAHAPTMEKWIPTLAATVGVPDKETYLIGHSMGCSTILRYLERLPEGQAIGGAVLVAGFVRLKPVMSADDVKIFEPWEQLPIQWDRIRKVIGKCVCLFSDNDHYVYHEDAPLFAEKLGAQTIVMHEMGHFSQSNGIVELPVVLEKILEISS